MEFAVIKTGGKQYKVSSGSKLKIEKLDAKEGEVVVFDNVLLTAKGEGVEIGAPYVNGVKVEARVTKQGRNKKQIVFRYHSKVRYRKKKGHRQNFTEVEITNIK
ncbi:MAG: 50S ribosomal protein L21 [Patescibacteria group bacterium]